MVLTAVVVIADLKRGFGRLRLCHRVMAWHCGLHRVSGHRLAHAVHGFRLGALGQRQRPVGRGKHDQQ
jgi:hypothetical protein